MIWKAARGAPVVLRGHEGSRDEKHFARVTHEDLRLFEPGFGRIRIAEGGDAHAPGEREDLDRRRRPAKLAVDDGAGQSRRLRLRIGRAEEAGTPHVVHPLGDALIDQVAGIRLGCALDAIAKAFDHAQQQPLAGGELALEAAQ
jgi:hypothetical protein